MNIGQDFMGIQYLFFTFLVLQEFVLVLRETACRSSGAASGFQSEGGGGDELGTNLKKRDQNSRQKEQNSRKKKQNSRKKEQNSRKR